MAKTNQVADPEGIDTFAGTDLDDPLFLDESPAPAPEPKPYDPTMDPSNNRWDPKKYFGAQPKEIIVVKKSESDILGDPTGEKEIVIRPGINGYAIPIVKGRPTRVPRDFATMLIELGAAYRYSDIADAG